MSLESNHQSAAPNRSILDRLGLIGLLIAPFIWVLEAFVDTYRFHTGPLVQQLFSPDPHETWTRLVTISSILLFSLYAQFLVNRQRRLDEALQESETRYKTLFDHIGDGVAIYQAVNGGEDFVFVDFNRSGEEIEQVKRETLIGQSVLKSFPGVQEFGLFEVFQRVWATGEPERYPIALYQDERISGWRDNWVCKLPSGEIVAVYSDETERKQAEEALRASEAHYRAITESAVVGVSTVNEAEEITFVNKAFADMLGYTQKALIGMNLLQLTPPEQIEKITSGTQRRKAGHQDQYETALYHKDGHIIRVMVSVAPLRGADGSYQGGLGIITDLTSRLQMEAVLKKTMAQIEQAKQEWEATVDGLPQVICLLDQQQHILRANRAIERWDLGQVTDVHGNNVHGLLHPNCTDPDCYLVSFLNQNWRQLTNGQFVEYECWDEQVDRYLHIQMQSIFFQTSYLDKSTTSFAVLSLQDVTERKKAEQKIEQRTLELATLNEIGQALTASLDLQEILTLITYHTSRLLNTEASSVLLYDQEKDDLWFAAASGKGADFVLGKRLAMGQGVSGWVAQHGEPALVPDVTKDARWFNGFDQQSDFTTRSMVYVPLQSKGETIGVLGVVNKKDGTLDEQDLWLLSALAAPAATAIEHARLFDQLLTAREKQQALSRRLVEVQEAERRNVARELHDETGQALAAILLGLSMLEQEADQPKAVVSRAVEMESIADDMMENLHRLVVNLRPASLDHLGLVPALEQHIEIFGRQSGITARFQMIGLEEVRLPKAIETALYRVVQEALTNVSRHAQANRVDVILERRNNRVIAIIEDDGVGFDSQAAMQSSRLGLFGIRERAEMLNGTLTIESDIGKGTTLLVEVPYDHSHSDR